MSPPSTPGSYFRPAQEKQETSSYERTYAQSQSQASARSPVPHRESHARSRSKTSLLAFTGLPLSSSNRDGYQDEAVGALDGTFDSSSEEAHFAATATDGSYREKQFGYPSCQYNDGDEDEKLVAPSSPTGIRSGKRRRWPLSVWLGGSLLGLLLLLFASAGSSSSSSFSTSSSSSDGSTCSPAGGKPFLSGFIDILHPRREAIATLLTNPDFLPPVLALGHSLNRYEPARDHVILITNTSVFEERQLSMLRRTGWLIRQIDHIPVTDGPKYRVPDKYRGVMNKLHIWNMTEYEAVALIDGDTILVGSVGQPFDFLHMSDYPLAAVQDISDRGGDARRLEFKANLNAGAMWVKTNAALFTELVAASKNTETYDPRLPEQNFLSKFFAGRWLGLDVGYNLMVLYAGDGRKEYYDRLRPSARVLHFAASSKPWRQCVGEKLDLCMNDHLIWMENVKAALEEAGATPEDFVSAGWKLQLLFDSIASMGKETQAGGPNV